MKKIVVFLIVLACLCVPFVIKKQTIFQMPNIASVCLVTGQKEEFALQTVQSGDLVFNFCSLEEARQHLSEIDVKGLQFYFANQPIDEVLQTLKADIVSEENVNDIYIINAYTPYFADSVFVQNKKVNLQLAISNGKLIAGFPMILTFRSASS